MELIKYILTPNKLRTSAEIPYLARTVLNGSLTGKGLINALSFGSTVTSTDIKAVLDRLENVVAEQMAQGRSVNLGFVTLRPMIKGSFLTPDESFQKDKHRILVRANPSSKLVSYVNHEGSTARINPQSISPVLNSWSNLSVEGMLNPMPGQLLEARGNRLRFDKADLAQGLFILRGDGSVVRVNEYSRISGNRLGFKLPEALEPGESIRLKVTALFGSSIRSGELDAPILLHE